MLSLLLSSSSHKEPEKSDSHKPTSPPLPPMCVCVCVFVCLNLTKKKCATSTEHRQQNALKPPGKKDPAQSANSNSALSQGKKASYDHEQRTKSPDAGMIKAYKVRE